MKRFNKLGPSDRSDPRYLWLMPVIVVQVYHVLVVGTAEDRSNSYKSAEVDVGIDPGTDHFSHVLPTSSLPEILEF